MALLQYIYICFIVLCLTAGNEALPDISPHCDFEDSLCGYTSKPAFLYAWFGNWITNTNYWPSSGCSGIGSRYIAADAGTYGSTNEAKLISQPVPPGDNCLQFCYYVNGADSGKHTLSMLYTSNNKEQLMWTKYGNTGGWQHVRIRIPSGTDKYQITFKGTRTRGLARGNIVAIDDITSCSGRSTTMVPATTTVATTTTVPATTIPGLPIQADCDFDTSLCNYVRSATSTYLYSWQRVPSTRSAFPPRNGSHILSTSVDKYGTETTITTPKMAAGSRCLIFYYYISGKVTLEVSSDIDKKPSKVLWSHTGDSGSDWSMVQIVLDASLPANSKNYKIVLTASKPTFIVGKAALAIDDIQFMKEGCPGTKSAN